MLLRDTILYRTTHEIDADMNARVDLQDSTLFQLDEELVFAWAQEHKDMKGAYPIASSGPVVSVNSYTADITWAQINNLLYNGFNGLPPKLRLRTFIESLHRVHSPLTESQILEWANEHKKKHNAYPTAWSGGVEHRDADGDTWGSINGALMFGMRGLEGYKTLEELFAEHDAKSNLLNEDIILNLADDFCLKFGTYPNCASIGEVDLPGIGKKRWKDVDRYLMNGMYGLPKRRPRDNLYDFLSRHRSVDQLKPQKAKLTIKKIVEYAIIHRDTVGERPHALSGTITGTYSESWSDVESALRNGGRGFAGGSSLKELLDEFMPEESIPVDSAGIASQFAATSSTSIEPAARFDDNLTHFENTQKKAKQAKKLLSLERVLTWFDKHKATEGYYPVRSDDKIPGGYGRTWADLEDSLLKGDAGVDAKLSLEEFALKYRPRKPQSAPTVEPSEVASQRAEKTHTLPTAEYLAFSRPSFAGKGVGSPTKRNSTINLSSVLNWIDRYHEVHGDFPRITSGKLDETSDLSWKDIAEAIANGMNDLPKCDSLSKFIYLQYAMVGSKLIGRPKHLLPSLKN